ncbi:hypothetical protein [Gordonia zhaorongruii]|uniref:hypothetical protein n=1 Tax=Gordonia zhaorongruii TaxID=2597659 RepID=UPI001F2353B9|nr:hypothetical protein [Gordonia zhaorongruii]
MLDERKATTSHAGARSRRGRGASTLDRPSRSKAAQRALDRRERRGSTVATMTKRRIGGVPLVFPVLVLIVGALALTLYLSTRSAQDSYAIDALREQNQTLQNRADGLKREFDKSDTAPELAQKAGRLGMVPSDGAAQVVIGPNGKSRVVGEAERAEGKPLPALNPAPDPVAKIDESKVDDSKGLGGDRNTSGTRAPDDRAPADTAPDDTASPDAPDAQDSPTSNVIPSAAATPTPNPAPAH